MLRRLVAVFVLAGVVLGVGATFGVAQEDNMRLYMVPSESVQFPDNPMIYYGPLYFQWRFGTGTLPKLGQVDYGFVGGYLVLADLTQEDHDWLIAHSDVFAFPIELDIAINPQSGLSTFMESVNLPTDWMTAATTYREFLHKTYGIIRFAQRYAWIAGENGATGPDLNLWNSMTMDTRLRQAPANVQAWFYATVASYGLDPSFVNENSRLRQLVKSAADYLETPLTIGGETF